MGAAVKRHKLSGYIFGDQLQAEVKDVLRSCKRGTGKTRHASSLEVEKVKSLAEEKLQHLRKQAASKNEEASRAIDELHKEIIESDNLRVQIRQRTERAESLCVQAEREADAEKVMLEQEKKDMVQSYQRLEKVVVNHLRNLRNAVTDESDPLNESSVAFV